MNNIKNTEKIAFCITCMNRLKHLQQTLEKNIQDNYLIGNVEFVLLDYNSQDGLGEWVYNTMRKYIDEGILVYYRTTEPVHYLRSHSRNMAFRLANAIILCNLDADNFLGKGFASFMLKEFSKYKDMFYTNNYSIRDTFGRFCVSKQDFMSIKGYNESLKGYGFEDADIFRRLRSQGLKQLRYDNPEFYHFVVHAYADRILEEPMAKNEYGMYITYINPYTSGILCLYKDYTLEQFVLVNNLSLNILADFSDISDSSCDERIRVVIKDDIIKGSWRDNEDNIFIQENGSEYKVQKKSPSITFECLTFYKIQGDELKARIIATLNDAINFVKGTKQMKDKCIINPDGFGKGFVYKNFDLSNKIILS